MGGRDDVPLFDDETGEALNAAARQLVLDALEADLQKPGDETSSAPLGPALRSIPVVRCAEGTYKYVQVQLTHPDAPGAQLLVVRSYSSCRYHAENYQRLMRELRAVEATKGVVGRVVGGGRIRFDRTTSRARQRRCGGTARRSGGPRGATSARQRS